MIDYLYWSEALRLMAFYDFCRCIRLEKTSMSKTKNTADECLGVLRRHELKDGHLLALTHRLIEHTSEVRKERTNLLIPRVVGMSIPRRSDKGYHILHWLISYCLMLIIHFYTWVKLQQMCTSPVSSPLGICKFWITGRQYTNVRMSGMPNECENVLRKQENLA